MANRQGNTQNAHIRGKQRESTETQSNDAARLMDDPAFLRAYETVRSGLLYELENLKHDGGKATRQYEAELCRTLRTLTSLKRALSLGVQRQTLRLADFQNIDRPIHE